MIAWTTVENALHAWVVAGSGLPSAKVLWAQQAAPVPAKPYLSLRALTVDATGRGWTEVVPAASPAPGAEISHRARGARVLTLSIQCIAADATQSGAAVAILERLVAMARLPGQRALLEAAGAAVASIGVVQSVDALANGLFEPRARTDARIHLTSEVSEVGTYISTVEVENQVDDSDFVVGLD